MLPIVSFVSRKTIKLTLVIEAYPSTRTSQMSPDDRRKTFMKLTMSSMENENAKKLLEQVQAKRLAKLVEF